ncbi:hypothetical protein LCGC14_1814420 [marine sediment metagenome]|uniref:HNH nuclease domain-containing protein n=1 Tax=marine sediment metagenome TaxID=412755 RepID=A0A0F9GKN3_9ZZZZ
MEHVTDFVHIVSLYLGETDNVERLTFAFCEAADDVVYNARHSGADEIALNSFALWRRLDYVQPEDGYPDYERLLSVLIIKDVIHLLSPGEIAILRALLVRYDPYDPKTYDTAKERKKVTDSLRFQILARDNFTCQSCGAKPDPLNNDITLKVDHIIPVSRGGKTHPDNLQTLCQHCNSGKGAKIVKELIDDNLLYQPPDDAYHRFASSPKRFIEVTKPSAPLTKWQSLVKALARIIFGDNHR